MKALTSRDESPSAVTLGLNGDYLFMQRSGDKLARIKVEGGELDTLSFAARMNIDYPTERQQVYNEAWRVLDAGFYDPNFHGQDS